MQHIPEREAERDNVGIGTAIKAPRPEKHQAIDTAIYEQKSVISSLENLISRINPAPEEVSETGIERGQSTLIDVLNHAPDRIHENTERLHKLIAELEQMLF